MHKCDNSKECIRRGRCKYSPGGAVGAPDPKNYRIRRIFEDQGGTVAMVQYPDCTNYEGLKCLVFGGMSVPEVLALDEIDPHFSDSGPVTARFKPTEAGWCQAVGLVEKASEGEG
jgi:hypothetical protein